MSNRSTSSNASTAHPSTTQATGQLPHEKIAMRAYEKWCKRGRPQGTDKLDWMEAEAELRAEIGRTQGQTTTQQHATQTQTRQPVQTRR